MAAPASDVDLSIFKEIRDSDQCDGRDDHADCPAEQRIGVVLKYSQVLMAAATSPSAQLSARQCVIAFCDTSYPKKVALSDYIDFVRHHGDDESLRSFASRLGLKCASVADCGWTQRHLRTSDEDAKESAETRPVRHACVDRLDALHFNVLHLHEVGLRAKAADDAQDMKSYAKDMEEKSKTLHVDRFDGATNNKFNIAAAAVTSQSGALFCNIHYQISIKVCCLGLDDR